MFCSFNPYQRSLQPSSITSQRPSCALSPFRTGLAKRLCTVQVKRMLALAPGIPVQGPAFSLPEQLLLRVQARFRLPFVAGLDIADCAGARAHHYRVGTRAPAEVLDACEQFPGGDAGGREGHII